jgi:hypothetical protein
MPLPWVRMDTAWASNPKFLTLVEDGKWRAGFVYWAALAWSAAHGLNGFIPPNALALNHATRKQATELEEVRLWLPGDGGWQINDYDEFQLSSEEHALRSKKAREAALVRWERARRPPP